MKYLYIFAFFLVILGGVYGVGHHNGYAQSQAEVTAQVAKANAEARDTEQKLNAQVADLTTQLVKVQNDAQKQIAKRDADIANGKLQLYVRTKGTICAPTNAPATSGNQTDVAVIDPGVASAIVAITDKGDEGIRRLNACVAIYEQVRSMINIKQQ